MATTARSRLESQSSHQKHQHQLGSSKPRPQQREPGSHFPPQPLVDPDSQTLSNTIANTSLSGHDAAAPLVSVLHSASSPSAGTAQMTDAANWRRNSAEQGNAPRRSSLVMLEKHSSGPNGSGRAPVAQNGGPSQPGAGENRRSSYAPSIPDGAPVSRKNTLKKKPNARRSASLKRSGSRRSMKAGSVRSLALQSSSDPDELRSAFYCPVPTAGNPTELLAARFQAWRRILKDLITYFRDVQNHYDHRAKSLLKLSNCLNNISTPPGFLSSGGIDDALQMLRKQNKQAIMESQKAREIEEDVILALTGLRSDLHLKIKEIKNLSGDFKNCVGKEMDATRRAVNNLQEVLGQADLDSSLTTGKQDPYLLRLAVDRQLERQLDEENYLHQAYLNLECSGRELESIVVGEVQKSYNALASIMKRDADCVYNTVGELRLGPISMPKDYEWSAFISRDDNFVDPQAPIRAVEHIHYPGRDHCACQELRAGLLERKSKYLKSYTAGWYVLSPTHLHEFKSADKTGIPIMSLYLPEQKLGSHSLDGASSNKFILKGRQTGSMHRGHTWVFRAETYDTMMAWYEDIKALTEKTPQERSDFVRNHSRAGSRASVRPASVSSDGAVDEEDEEAFGASAADMNTVTAKNQHIQQGAYSIHPQRPIPDSIASSSGGPDENAALGDSYPAVISSSPTKFVPGLAPEGTRSASVGEYPHVPVPTSHPSSLVYDPNLIASTNNPIPKQYLMHDALAQAQQLRTPSPPIDPASKAGDESSPPAMTTKMPVDSIPNGTPPKSRLSHVSIDGAAGPPAKVESAAIRAAAAVMGNGRSVSPRVTSYECSGSDRGSPAGRKKSKKDSSRTQGVSSLKSADATTTTAPRTGVLALHMPGSFPRGVSS